MACKLLKEEFNVRKSMWAKNSKFSLENPYRNKAMKEFRKYSQLLEKKDFHFKMRIKGKQLK